VSLRCAPTTCGALLFRMRERGPGLWHAGACGEKLLAERKPHAPEGRLAIAFPGDILSTPGADDEATPSSTPNPLSLSRTRPLDRPG
jgi:hypothetical protein